MSIVVLAWQGIAMYRLSGFADEVLEATFSAGIAGPFAELPSGSDDHPNPIFFVH